MKDYNMILKSEGDTFERWVKFGKKIKPCREAAAKDANGATRGENYNAALKKRLGSFYDTYTELNKKGVITALMNCIDNLEEVEAFRNKMYEAKRPSNPVYMWLVYSKSIIIDDEETTSSEETGAEETDADEDKPKKKRGNGGKSREKELLRAIEELKQELLRLHEKYELTGNAQTDAARLFRRAKEVLGETDHTMRYGLEFAKEFAKICQSDLDWIMKGSKIA